MSMPNFGQANSATITILVDNWSDLLAQSTDTVKRYDGEPLLAEHGFAALVDLDDGAARILWDAGITSVALLWNMEKLKIDPASIHKIALSHGHGDHTAAVTAVLQAMELRPDFRKWEKGTNRAEMSRYAAGRRVPVIAHPAAFRERWGTDQDGAYWGPILPPPRAEWEAAGAEVVLSEGPAELGPGCWTTGPVPRRAGEPTGVPPRLLHREGEDFLPDHIEEDQSLVVNVKDKGLIVLTGCAHSGITNTVEHARAISGVERVWAILGGFHMGRLSEEELEKTVETLCGYQPVLIAPSHCTGFAAIRRIAEVMPEAFVQGLVGTQYLF